MKRYFFASILVLLSVNLFSLSYKIESSTYNITGSKFLKFSKTREYALRQAVEIDYNKIFSSIQEFEEYINELKQLFANQRIIESCDITYSFGVDENLIIPVNLAISTVDTWNIFPLPYPKYDSNDGFTLKLKIKDYNFFGSMRTFNFDILYAYAKFPNEDKPDENQIGLNFDFEIPFKMGIFDATLSNSASISFTIGNEMPNFDFATKLNLYYPLWITKLNLGFEQKITYNDDYLETDDAFYFTEVIYFSVPFDVYKIKNWATIKITPYANITWNWDKDIFSEDNPTSSVIDEDLQGPVFNVGITLSNERIDWDNNFRKGFSVSVQPYHKTNMHTLVGSPGITTEIKEYYHIGNILGINSRLKFYYNINDDIEAGDRIRGLLNDNVYSTTSYLSLNLDLPLRVISTDWVKWGWTKYKIFSFLKHLDFELQFSPFFDCLISKNTLNDTTFSFRDGWYSCGAEVLIFPRKMRSLQVRVSYGFDLTSVMSDSLIDNKWRPDRPNDEIFFGVGLFY